LPPITAQIINKVAPTHIQQPPHRNKCAEPDQLSLGPIENCRTQRAALADETDVSWPCNMRSKGRVQSVQRVHHAQAVRAKQPHGTALDTLKNLSLQLLSRFAVLFEAS